MGTAHQHHSQFKNINIWTLNIDRLVKRLFDRISLNSFGYGSTCAVGTAHQYYFQFNNINIRVFNIDRLVKRLRSIK
ncbi:hypothetical protein C7B77_01945 [Chamaesiphon polymorphus CCALA 037]|uniref:Uncharacterized protein n=1 Tax=Chamaesiphon polymorphus CCALA 037 TaxID=2107692 RepID=A0A2T1GMN8_9CYAN|nr:hypothetical protein C7B77_01945 [Chamaesiphon polymorphus CCALA 037]